MDVMFDPTTESTGKRYWDKIQNEPLLDCSVTVASLSQGQAWFVRDEIDGEPHAVLIHRDAHGLVTAWEFRDSFGGLRTVDAGDELFDAIAHSCAAFHEQEVSVDDPEHLGEDQDEQHD